MGRRLAAVCRAAADRRLGDDRHLVARSNGQADGPAARSQSSGEHNGDAEDRTACPRCVILAILAILAITVIPAIGGIGGAARRGAIHD
jgi:hypothetical protein